MKIKESDDYMSGDPSLTDNPSYQDTSFSDNPSYQVTNKVNSSEATYDYVSVHVHNTADTATYD